MRQKITFEQAKELRFKEREALFEWFKKKMDPALVLAVMNDRNNMRTALAQISIGDLIQFLKESDSGPIIIYCLDDDLGDIVDIGGDEFEQVELIDALWLATKKILKEQCAQN